MFIPGMKEINKMDTMQFAEGQYVNAELLKTSPSKKVYIAGDAKIVEGKFGDRLELPVELDGKPKTWTLNRDQVKTLHQAYGKDSKLWVGKTVKLTPVNLGGKETLVCEPETVKTEEVL